MRDLIRMDLYRMFRSKVFYINLIIIALGNIATKVIFKVAMDALTSPEVMEAAQKQGDAETSELLSTLAYPKSVSVSELLGNPFAFNIFLILVFLSVVSFCYADIAGGYIKNYAGQLPKKGYTVISKFICIAVHNLLFMIVALVSIVGTEAVVRTVDFDSQAGAGALTFLLKFLLLQSMSAVILFVTTGLHSKTFASVCAVVFSTGLLGMIYMGFDYAAEHFLKISDLNSAKYAPDQLILQSRIAWFNGVIVSVVVSAVFIAITYGIYNKSDVK